MRTIEVHGAKIEIPDHCDCGSTCSDEVAAAHVQDWNKSGRKCAFCGRLIRVASLTMKHYHKDRDDPDTWSSSEWAVIEPNWSWLSSGPYGRVQIDVHVSCCKESMPYAEFEKSPLEYERPEVIQEEQMPPRILRNPCRTCGADPTDEDVRRVAARVFNFMGPCVYCGRRIKLRKLVLFHGPLTGEHTGRWHFSDYGQEPTLCWQGYMDSGSYKLLEFSGHLFCAHHAMGHAEWLEVNEKFWMRERTFTGRENSGLFGPKDWFPSHHPLRVR